MHQLPSQGWKTNKTSTRFEPEHKQPMLHTRSSRKTNKTSPDLRQSISSLCYIANLAKMMNQVKTVVPWFKQTDYVEETHEKKTAWANIKCINSLHKAGKHTRLAPDLSQSISSICYIPNKAKMMNQVGTVLPWVQAN
jgi:hypothetical protein